MRILHIITSLRTGGAERLVTDLLAFLRGSASDVSLLVFDGTNTPLLNEIESRGIRVHSLSKGAFSMRNPLMILRLVNFLRKEKFDIVHTHNYSCQLFAAVASLFTPVTLVTTEHNTTNRRRAWKWFRCIDRWMYGRYSRIVCVGEETREALLGSIGGSFADKTTVVLNGIDTGRMTDAEPAADIVGIDGHKIAMVAAFRSQKDQTTVIRAMSLLPDNYRLVLAGGAHLPQDMRNLSACKALVSELGLDERVSFLGERSDAPSVMAACDVVVLSSHFEGFPLSAVEGMASGKPFVASDVPGLSSLVTGAGELFPEGDFRTLAGILERLCENPTLASGIAARCAGRVEGYDISRVSESYMNEYEKVLTNNNKSKMNRIMKVAGTLIVAFVCLLSSPGVSAAVKPQWVRGGEEAMNRKRISENYVFKVFHTSDADLSYLKEKRFEPLMTYVRELYGANPLTMSLDSLESIGSGDVTYRVTFKDASGDGVVYARKVDEFCEFDDFETNEFGFEYYQLYAVSEKNIHPVFDNFEVKDFDRAKATALSIIPGVGQINKGEKLKGFGIMGTEAVLAAGAIVSHVKYKDYQKNADNGVPHADSWHSKATSCKVARNLSIGAFAGVWVYGLIDAAMIPGGTRVVVSKPDGRQVSLSPSSSSAGVALTFRF